MQPYLWWVDNWLLSIPHRALKKAYETSKKIQSIQKDYLVYKDLQFSTKPSSQNMLLYVDAVLEELTIKIYWNLLKFRLSKFFVGLVRRMTRKGSDNLSVLNADSSLKKKDKTSKLLDTFYYPYSDKENNKCFSKKNWSKNISRRDQLQFDWSTLPNSQQIYSKLESEDIELRQIQRKLAWIEATLKDLETWKSFYLYANAQFSRTSNKTKKDALTENLSGKISGITYESIGLVPRSITRTLSRFQNELAGRSSSLVLQEFRLAKYQALASTQYMACLIGIPWGLSFFCKIFFLRSWVENWWNVSQSQVFLNFSQEDKALKRLQEVEELLWLDIIMGDSADKQPEDLADQIHKKTIELVEVYNQESVHTILDLLTDLVLFFTVIGLLFLGKKRLAVLNSWIQELFYSLSDTMKAFFILLFTDLCIGFHSPHGWEIFVGFLLEHFGFAHNKHVISCFVSTFPVILDTVFKYWIFRHLNRISPSIVVSYHTMNE